MSDKTEVDTNDHELLAVQGLPQNAKEVYKEIGHDLFGHLKFKGVSLIQETKTTPDEIAAYVIQQLKDGIHPSMLEEGDKALLCLNFGNEWYIKWGYVEADLTEIVTIDRN